MTRIAYLAGADAQTRLELGRADIDLSGCTDLYRLRTRDPGGYWRLHVTPDFFDQPVRYDLSRYDLLLNLVTDPDLNPRVTAAIARMVEGWSGRLLNPPERVMRTARDDVWRLCSGLANVVSPRTVRLSGTRSTMAAAAQDLRYPAILREAGSHGGRILGLVESPDAAAAKIRSGHDHFLTEYVDFRSDDGLYRKWRFFFIGDEIVVRHRLASDRWNIHAADRMRFVRERSALVREEQETIERGVEALPAAVREGLKAIRTAVGLDFFGLDCALSPDRIVLFEANATMNFFPLSDDPLFSYLRHTLEIAQRAFDTLLFGPAEYG